MIASLCLAAGLFAGFQEPPAESRPWCYWLWQNTNVDRDCITRDLEDMKRLGFAAVLFSDTRGYGQSRVRTPEETMPVFSETWYDLFDFALREADRLGIKFTMNISSSGGTLKGPWPVGEDAPKRLVAGLDVTAPDSSFTNYHPCAAFALKVPHGTAVSNGWTNAGGVVDRWAKDADDVFREALEWREIAADAALPADDAAGAWHRLTFGSAMIAGRECDVDVLDAAAVERHFNRLAGPIFRRAGDLVGKTLTHFYSVSWEGAVPTWTPTLEAEFKTRAGYDLRPHLPALAGWQRKDGKSAKSVLTDYRTVRNDLFRDKFYGTFRDLCHRHGLQMYSESGGPWNRGESVFRHADQLEFLAVNDMPQGESWTIVPSHHAAPHHNRAAAACARLYDKKRASCESFTHMDFHWSIAPSLLKRRADEEFADGINLIVWHTYTASPASQGVPGLEYFAGTHVNRNVTWNREAPDIVRYLARCQHLLSWGTAVMDLAVYGGDEVYTHWDKTSDRTDAWEGCGFKLPQGYTYDVVNKDVMERLARREGAGLTVPCGTRYRFFVDASGEKVTVPSLPRPDCEGPFRSVHRTDGRTDIYFLSGCGRADVVFDISRGNRRVELWNALDGTRRLAESEATADGRTRVKVDLPTDGSVFVVFNGEPTGTVPAAKSGAWSYAAVEGPWDVAFAYPDGIRAKPPKPATWAKLHDWKTDANWSVRDFSGTATYRTTFETAAAGAVRLNVGEIPDGVARVVVNGRDCGLAWCAPWEVDITPAARAGRNELEIRVTNTWFNRLVADTRLPEAKRVTKSCLNSFTDKFMSDHWTRHCAGYCPGDGRRSAGLVGPVLIIIRKENEQ